MRPLGRLETEDAARPTAAHADPYCTGEVMLRLLFLGWITLVAACPLGLGAAPLQFQYAFGGDPAEPLLDGSRAYVALGATISVFDYADVSAPVLRAATAQQPVNGVITGLARHGDYLYASYDGALDVQSGVAVYSLLDPWQPALVADVDDYTTSAFRDAVNVLVHNERLYLFDAQSGVYVSGLQQPAAPEFAMAYFGPALAAEVTGAGNQLTMAGKAEGGIQGVQVVTVLDASDPDNLQWLGEGGFYHPASNMALALPLAASFGHFGVELYDFSDPENPQTVGTYHDNVSLYAGGVLLPDRALALGWTALHVYDTSDPQQLGAPVVELPIDTFMAERPAVADGALLAATRNDRLVRLDVTDTPVLRSDVALPGTAAPYDVGFHDGRILVLSNVRGLQVLEGASLAPIAEFQPALPPVANRRAYEQMVLHDDIAYLASWGTGLVMVDVSTPEAPDQLSVFPYDYVTGLAVHGTTAYLGRVTQGGEITAVDVSDPTVPRPMGVIAATKPVRLRATPSHLFVADSQLQGGTGGGLRIIDVTDPVNLREVSLYAPEGCTSATDLELSADARVAYVACLSGLHIVDVSDPAAPAMLGSVQVDQPGAPFNALAVSGERAWYGTARGLVEIDVSNVAQPSPVRELALPWVANELRVAPDGRLFAATGAGGIVVFAPSYELFADGFE